MEYHHLLNFKDRDLRRFMVLRTAITALIIYSALAHAAIVTAQINVEQKAILYIETTCENPDTGAISTRQGTGFIVTADGYVVTASHVVSCASKPKNFRRVNVITKIGSPHEPIKNNLEVISFNRNIDLAILKIKGTSRTYSYLRMCALRKHQMGTRLAAVGFPEGEGYRVVDVTVGENTSGGRWGVTSGFSSGMSGGPVLEKGVVVGVIKGGRGSISALRVVTPLYFGRSLIEDITGIALQECSKHNVKIQSSDHGFERDETPEPVILKDR